MTTTAQPLAPVTSSSCAALCCVVVEDQTMFLQLLVGMLRTLPGIDVAGTATTLASAVEVCRSLPIDLLIVDLTLPDGSGLDAFRVAVDSRPGVMCVVLSSAASDFVCPQPLRHNLRAVIDKAHSFERLQAVISDIVRQRDGAKNTPSATTNPITLLSPRELEVFRLIGLGMKTTEISTQLAISMHTVETHRKNIAAKLGASRGELVRLATIHNQTSLTPRAER